jgi:hypothetical protein
VLGQLLAPSKGGERSWRRIGEKKEKENEKEEKN